MYGMGSPGLTAEVKPSLDTDHPTLTWLLNTTQGNGFCHEGLKALLLVQCKGLRLFPISPLLFSGLEEICQQSYGENPRCFMILPSQVHLPNMSFNTCTCCRSGSIRPMLHRQRQHLRLATKVCSFPKTKLVAVHEAGYAESYRHATDLVD